MYCKLKGYFIAGLEKVGKMPPRMFFFPHALVYLFYRYLSMAKPTVCGVRVLKKPTTIGQQREPDQEKIKGPCRFSSRFVNILHCPYCYSDTQALKCIII